MAPIVSTARITAALEEIPLTPPQPVETQFGWAMGEELIQRWKTSGPLRQGVHDLAARTLADLAEAMLDSPVCLGPSSRILLLLGPGGNGADGLRAGRVLAERGRKVDIMILLSGEAGYAPDYPAGHPNQPLLAELLEAGGQVITGAQIIQEDLTRSHALILEAILGSGFQGILSGLMASWAERSGLLPTLAVDVPAGVVADTGSLPLLEGRTVSGPASPGGHRRPPTVTLALGALRPAHTTAHCGEVLLARCGLEVEPDFSSTTTRADLTRLLDPELGFPVPENIDTLVMDLGESPAESWRHVHSTRIGILTGGVDCLGFGDLAIQGLRGAGTWHHLSLLSDKHGTAHLTARHPDLDIHADLTTAGAPPPAAWVVETRDPGDLSEILTRPEPIILGPRAIDTLSRQSLLHLLRERTHDTIVITRDPDLDGLGAWATVIQLGEKIITTSHPDIFNPGHLTRDHLDPGVPLGKIQGIEAVIAGISGLSPHYMTLYFLSHRMRELRPRWPVTAADIAGHRP